MAGSGWERQSETERWMQKDAWVTRNGRSPLAGQTEELERISVTEAEIASSVRVVPSLDTLILIKAMGRAKRFGNPFKAGSGSPEPPSAALAAVSLSGPVPAVPAVPTASAVPTVTCAERQLAQLARGTVHKLSPRRANTLQD